MQHEIRTGLLVIPMLIWAFSAMAQNTPPPPASVPPPPNLNQPVEPLSPPSARPVSTLPPATRSKDAIRSNRKIELPGSKPEVITRHEHGDKIEEYRISGRLVSIRIIPPHGPVQTFYANSQGVLRPDSHEGPVLPVYYTLYQWTTH